MIFVITYLLFIIWLSLTIKNKTKNLYNVDLAKKVHMYKYIWIFILVVLGVVKAIQFTSSIWVLILILVVLKEYIILILRIIIFRIYFETKKIHNYHMIFNLQNTIHKLVGIELLLSYLKFKSNLINFLQILLPVVLCFNQNTLVILLLILVWLNLNSHVFNYLMDCASINMHYEDEIILNPYGKSKVKQYHNNLMHCRIVSYRETNLRILRNQDFVFVENWLNNE